MCMKKDECDYYIEGKADATELVEKYTKCFSKCPSDFPVQADGSKMCRTCADITDQQRMFWIGGNSHTIESCSSSCPSSFYMVVGDFY